MAQVTEFFNIECYEDIQVLLRPPITVFFYISRLVMGQAF